MDRASRMLLLLVDSVVRERTEATEKLYKAVDGILTKGQKELIEKVNDAYAKVAAEVGEDFQAKFAAAKGNAEETAADAQGMPS